MMNKQTNPNLSWSTREFQARAIGAFFSGGRRPSAELAQKLQNKITDHEHVKRLVAMDYARTPSRRR